MSDLISRQAVLNLIDGWTYDLCNNEDAWRATEEIENLPSAEPEIIRCGKCTHKDKKIDYCHYLGITICGSDFCSYGEAKGEEDE